MFLLEDHRPPSDMLLRQHRYSAQSSKEDILTFLKDVQSSKISDPKYQSYQGLESLCEDNLLVTILNFLIDNIDSLASKLHNLYSSENDYISVLENMTTPRNVSKPLQIESLEMC